MIKKIASFILIFVIFAFLFSNLWQNRVLVEKISWNFSTIDFILLIISLSGVYITSVVSWHLLTICLDLKLTFRSNFRIWMLSNFSRLLPGGIWQYLSRVYMLKKAGVSNTQSISAVILEGILNLSAASLVFLMSIPYWDLPKRININHSWFVFLLITPPTLLFILTNKKSMRLLFTIMNRVSGKKGNIKSIPMIPIKFLIPLVIIFTTRFITTGSVLYFIFKFSQTISEGHWSAFIGIFSLSWIFGYLTVLSPGGLGVVELSLATMLSLYLSFTLVVALAIVFRLVLFLGELFFLFLSLKLFKS